MAKKDPPPPPPPPPNVKVTQEDGVDPQLILTLATLDGMPFHAKIEVDLTIRNVNDRRVFGHARTVDYVRDSEFTIPINYSDSLGEWKRAVEMDGAMLGYGVAIHLFHEDGREEHKFHTAYMSPRDAPPIEVEGVENQFATDAAHTSIPSLEEGFIPAGTVLQKGQKYFGPHGLFYVSFQDDGNLCTKHDRDEGFIWGSHNMNGVPLYGSRAEFSPEGSIVIYSPEDENEMMWSTETEGGAYLSITEDGIPVILDQEGHPMWMG